MEKEKKLPVRVSMEFNFDLDNVYTPYKRFTVTQIWDYKSLAKKC